MTCDSLAEGTQCVFIMSHVVTLPIGKSCKIKVRLKRVKQNQSNEVSS